MSDSGDVFQDFEISHEEEKALLDELFSRFVLPVSDGPLPDDGMTDDD
jgi:hypothetical protein